MKKAKRMIPWLIAALAFGASLFVTPSPVSGSYDQAAIHTTSSVTVNAWAVRHDTQYDTVEDGSTRWMVPQSEAVDTRRSH